MFRIVLAVDGEVSDIGIAPAQYLGVLIELHIDRLLCPRQMFWRPLRGNHGIDDAGIEPLAKEIEEAIVLDDLARIFSQRLSGDPLRIPGGRPLHPLDAEVDP